MLTENEAATYVDLFNRCVNCSNPMPLPMMRLKFCQQCGTQQAIVIPLVDDAGKKCLQCDTPEQRGRYCIECGNPMAKKAPLPVLTLA